MAAQRRGWLGGWGSARASRTRRSPGRCPAAAAQTHTELRASPREAVEEAQRRCRASGAFERADERAGGGLRRVLGAFRDARVGPHHLQGSTGYGHDDLGREALDEAAAAVFAGAEKAAVRAHFMSGTHTIACGLFGALRPGDELLALAGHPYDTLEEVLGLRGRKGDGSLREWGVSYREHDLLPDGTLDFEGIPGAMRPETKAVLVQRSRGYDPRPSLRVADIGRAAAIVKEARPDVAVLVDNCYGEFVEEDEPTAVGADLIMGSLIKNPGGTIAPCGGYVAGRADLVENAVARLSAPGVGHESGATSADVRRLLFQGLFLAPGIVGEAVKGGELIAEAMSAEGYRVTPAPGEPRSDIITAVELGSPEKLLAFCRAVQEACPVSAYVLPTPGATPGYASEVVFANGTFIEGSTSELSADGPLREPYIAYCQGGTHWTHWAIALESALTELRKLDEAEA